MTPLMMSKLQIERRFVASPFAAVAGTIKAFEVLPRSTTILRTSCPISIRRLAFRVKVRSHFSGRKDHGRTG